MLIARDPFTGSRILRKLDVILDMFTYWIFILISLFLYYLIYNSDYTNIPKMNLILTWIYHSNLVPLVLSLFHRTTWEPGLI